jgi:hypothetical protein
MRTNFDITIKSPFTAKWIEEAISNQLVDGEEITNFRISSNLSETEMYVTFDLSLRKNCSLDWVYETIYGQLKSDEEIVIYNTHSIIA